MTTPNLAYAYGTTPAASGGQAAILQAIQSMFLGVNTTVASAITTAPGAMTVTPASMTNIGVGTAVWINWGLSDQECVSVTAVTGSTFTAYFTRNHSANYTVGVGLNYQNNITNPWSLASNFTYTNISSTYISSANTSAGDNDYIPILVGFSTGTNLFFATADDIDTSGNNTTPSNLTFIAPSGAPQITPTTISATGFSWWMCICEFGIFLLTYVGNSYYTAAAGTLMTAQNSAEKGVGTATASIASGATTVTVTPDISLRIQPGQRMLIVNNSHSSTSTNWGSGGTAVTGEVYGSGNGSTLTFAHNLADVSGTTVPCVPGSFVILVTGSSVGTDNGAGLITGTNIASGTINYVTGACSVTFSAGHAPPNASNNITCNYKYGISSSEVVTVSTVTGNGTNATITFPATTRAFDTGALVGSVPAKYAGTLTNVGTEIYLSRFNDGTYTGCISQAGSVEASMFGQASLTSFNPSDYLNTFYLGEAPLPIYSSTANKFGISGYPYCIQMFVNTPGTTEPNILDAFVDVGNQQVWKIFISSLSNFPVVAIGPLVNAQNTQANMTPYGSTPWIP